MKIIEDKGSKKRYKIKLKKEAGFFKKLFGGEDEHYTVVVLAKKEVEVEELQELSKKVMDKKDDWKEAKKTAKSSDYTCILEDYKHITFFIYKSTEDDSTSEKTDKPEGDKESL